MPSVSARRLIKILPCRGLSAALRYSIPEQGELISRRDVLLRCSPAHSADCTPAVASDGHGCQRRIRGEDRALGGLHEQTSADHAGRLLCAARLADRSRKARRPLSAARARQGTVARRARISRSRAGRRDLAGDPRAGAGRARHHHRRRDAARKLLQPLRDRARRRRHRQSRHRARPLRPSQSGAARDRQGAAQAPGGGARRRSSCAATPTA